MSLESCIVARLPREIREALGSFPPGEYATRCNRDSWSFPPIRISRNVHQNSFKIHLEDFQALEKAHHEIIPLIEQYTPQVIGISATTTSYPQAAKMAAAVKRYFPEIKLLLGGIHGSALPEKPPSNPIISIAISSISRPAVKASLQV